MSTGKTTIVLLGLLLATSCQPGGRHLPPEKMEQVLLDVQLAEVYGSMAGKDTAQNTVLRNNDSLVVYYREVLAHHHVTLKDFTESLDWYRQRPELLDSIYVRAMDRLGKDQRLNNK